MNKYLNSLPLEIIDNEILPYIDSVSLQIVRYTLLDKKKYDLLLINKNNYYYMYSYSSKFLNFFIKEQIISEWRTIPDEGYKNLSLDVFINYIYIFKDTYDIYTYDSICTDISMSCNNSTVIKFIIDNMPIYDIKYYKFILAILTKDLYNLELNYDSTDKKINRIARLVNSEWIDGLKIILTKYTSSIPEIFNMAIKYGCISVLNLIGVQHLQYYGNTECIKHYSRYGNIKSLKWLKNQNKEICDYKLFRSAIRGGDIDIIKYLIKNNKINSNNFLDDTINFINKNILLSEIIYSNSVYIVQEIYENKLVDLNIDDFFYLCIKFANIDLLNYIYTNIRKLPTADDFIYALNSDCINVIDWMLNIDVKLLNTIEYNQISNKVYLYFKRKGYFFNKIILYSYHNKKHHIYRNTNVNSQY